MLRRGNVPQGGGGQRGLERGDSRPLRRPAAGDPGCRRCAVKSGWAAGLFHLHLCPGGKRGGHRGVFAPPSGLCAGGPRCGGPVLCPGKSSMGRGPGPGTGEDLPPLAPQVALRGALCRRAALLRRRGKHLAVGPACARAGGLAGFCRRLSAGRAQGGAPRPLAIRSMPAPPVLPQLDGLRVLRAGLELGQVRKGRFVPAHALALASRGAAACCRLDLDDPRLAKYLEGQQISGDARGWTLVFAGPYPIGWAEGSGGVLKNHFPEGLRHLPGAVGGICRVFPAIWPGFFRKTGPMLKKS